MTRTLFLHAGQPKTGSTWLQAALRLGREALAAQGIAYPAAPEGEPADPAAITAGNGVGLMADPAGLARRLAAGAAGARGVLFSSESLQLRMAERPDLGFLPETAARDGFGRIEVLLFVRDPVGHAASAGQQLVKRHGATEGPDALIERFDLPLKAADLLDRLAALDGRAGVGMGLTVRNYSVCRDRLLAETEAWLGVPEGTLAPPPAARANRSLTAGELALQRALNRALGDAAARHGSRALADPLCERLPDLPADPFLASPEAQRRMWDRLAPAMARVEARAPEAHRYRPDFRDPPAAAPGSPRVHAFTEEHLAAIAEGVAAEILLLRGELDRLRRAPEEGIPAPVLARGLLRRLARRLGGG